MIASRLLLREIMSEPPYIESSHGPAPVLRLSNRPPAQRRMSRRDSGSRAAAPSAAPLFAAAIGSLLRQGSTDGAGTYVRRSGLPPISAGDERGRQDPSRPVDEGVAQPTSARRSSASRLSSRLGLRVRRSE